MLDTNQVPHHFRAKLGAPAPRLNAVGLPEPETGQPIAPPSDDLPIGERQDGAGAAPRRYDRSDQVPAGSTAARRGGSDAGQREEPDTAHRGQPARFRTGDTFGSGAHAGGTRVGGTEEPGTDSAGGSGRDRRG